MISHKDLAGRDPGDNIVRSTEFGPGIHAVRPLADYWLLSIPEHLRDRPAVVLARHHLAEGSEGDLWRVSSRHVRALVQALADGDDATLLGLIASVLPTKNRITK